MFKTVVAIVASLLITVSTYASTPIPWVETICWDEDYRANPITGMDVWSTQSPYVVITFQANSRKNMLECANYYESELLWQQIIPSLKTNGYIRGDINNSDGWQEFWSDAELLCETLGTNMFVVEHESGLKKWLKEQYPITIDITVPSSLDVWWYPGATPLKESKYGEFFSHLKGDFKIVSFGYCGPDALTWGPAKAAQEFNESIAPTIPITYFLNRSCANCDWPPTSLDYLVKNVEQEYFLYYPGYTLFNQRAIESAKDLTEMYQTDITDLNDTVASQTQQIQQQESTITAQQTTIQEQQNTITAQATTIDRQANELHEKDMVIAEQTKTINSQKESLDKKDTKIAELQDSIQILNTTIAQMEKQIQDKDVIIATQKATISEQEALLQDKDKQIAAMESIIEEQNTTISLIKDYFELLHQLEAAVAD